MSLKRSLAYFVDLGHCLGSSSVVNNGGIPVAADRALAAMAGKTREGPEKIGRVFFCGSLCLVVRVIIDRGDLIKCDFVTAHNVILDGLEKGKLPKWVNGRRGSQGRCNASPLVGHSIGEALKESAPLVAPALAGPHTVGP